MQLIFFSKIEGMKISVFFNGTLQGFEVIVTFSPKNLSRLFIGLDNFK